jgi:hypothetical protein
MPGTPPASSDLRAVILDILLTHTDGLSEFDFLKCLGRTQPYFATNTLDTLALFQRHFMLFHCLYQLRQDLWASQSGHLVISALSIRLFPYRGGEDQAIDLADPLADYYLDITRLEATCQAELDAMLGAFWTRLARRDKRREALAMLGLTDPVSDHAIRQRYRELVMTHHPDRGGETSRIQILNAAMADLIPRGSGSSS